MSLLTVEFIPYLLTDHSSNHWTIADYQTAESDSLYLKFFYKAGKISFSFTDFFFFYELLIVMFIYLLFLTCSVEI